MKEREGLLSDFAHRLGEARDMQHEAERECIERQITYMDDFDSLSGRLYLGLQWEYHLVDDDSDDLTTYAAEPAGESGWENMYWLRHRAAGLAQSAGKWDEVQKLFESGDQEALAHQDYFAIKHLSREGLRSDKAYELMNGVMLLGFMAARNLPEEFEGEIPKKHKKETLRDKTFRTGITLLSKIAEMTPLQEQFLEIRVGLNEGDQDTDSVDAILQQRDMMAGIMGNEKYAHASFQNSSGLYAHSIVDMLVQMTPEEVQEEIGWAITLHGLEELDGLAGENEGDDVAAQELPLEETKWTILPKGTGIPHEGDGDGRESSDYVKSQVDISRLEWLREIGSDWPGDVRVAVANLESSGQHEYSALLLPEVIGGVLVHHVIAENPQTRDHATYVWRAEKGLVAGKLEKTWKDVFRTTRRNARRLGARIVLHTGNHDENVLEYLTRSPDELDRTPYRR